MMKCARFLLLFCVIILSGCNTVTPKTEDSQIKETSKEVQAAVTTVVDSVSGKKRIVRYCPVCGKHYSASVSQCSIDGATLQEIEE